VTGKKPTYSMFINLKKGTQLMSIYSQDYTPYFYIIQDVRNGMYYAGARWAQGCHPSELLKLENGYTTSSGTVEELIRQHGINNFIILKIRTFVTSNDAQKYETKFLKKVNAKSNPKFYNLHNNDGTLDPIKMKIVMMELYGVEHPMHSEEIKSKLKQTNMKRYGVENTFQSEIAKEKIKLSLSEKYGVDHPMKSEEIKLKLRDTNIEKYGVEYPLQSEEVMQKLCNTNMERYGVEYVFQSEEVKSKIRDTNMERYGVENISQSEITQMKIRNTSMKKYGVDHFTQSEIVKDKQKQTMKERYGVESPLQSEEIQRIRQKTMLKKYGTTSYANTEDFRIRNKEIKSKLANRDIVTEIKKYNRKYETGIKSGYYQKSDEDLDKILSELIEKFGKID